MWPRVRIQFPLSNKCKKIFSIKTHCWLLKAAVLQVSKKMTQFAISLSTNKGGQPYWTATASAWEVPKVCQNDWGYFLFNCNLLHCDMKQPGWLEIFPWLAKFLNIPTFTSQDEIIPLLFFNPPGACIIRLYKSVNGGWHQVRALCLQAKKEILAI